MLFSLSSHLPAHGHQRPRAGLSWQSHCSKNRMLYHRGVRRGRMNQTCGTRAAGAHNCPPRPGEPTAPQASIVQACVHVQVDVQVEVEVHDEQVTWVNDYGAKPQELREMKWKG